MVEGERGRMKKKENYIWEGRGRGGRRIKRGEMKRDERCDCGKERREMKSKMFVCQREIEKGYTRKTMFFWFFSFYSERI